jgi:hypothetical protein
MMKPLTIFKALVFLLVLSCEHKQDLPPAFLQNSDKELTDGFCVVSSDRVVLNHHDIEYYDYAAHLVYLKDPVSFSEDIVGSDVYAVYAGGDSIYRLTAMNAYDSYLPDGPLIWNQSFYKDFCMHIDLLLMLDPDHPEDPRVDPRIEEALLKYDQFHEGLACEIVDVQMIEPGHVLLELELKNEDSFDYCYLDPEKMGLGLFHYFTNGLYLRNASWDSFTHQLEVVQPDPWDTWDPSWLSVIESGETVSLTIDYLAFEEFPPGDYTAWFHFPGLIGQVQKDDLLQAGGRIWLGGLNLGLNLTVD